MYVIIKLLIAIMMIILSMKTLKIKENRKFEIIMSYSLICTFILNTIVLIITRGIEGFLESGLPLFHCSIGMMTHIYYLLKNKKPDIFLKNANVIGIYGSIIAIFFSKLIYENLMEYFVLVIAHTVFMLIALYNIWIKKIRMKKSEYKKCIIMLVLWNISMFIINIIFDTNYSFVNEDLFFNTHSIFILILNTLLFIILYFIDYKLFSKKGGN